MHLPRLLPRWSKTISLRFFWKMHNWCTVKSSFVILRLGIITRYNIYSFCVWTHSLESHFFLHLSYITIVTQGDIFKQIVYKKNYKFLRYVRTICSKIFARSDYFATAPPIGVSYFALKIFWAFLTFPQLCLAYPVLIILENWKKKHNFFRVKVNLAVQRFSNPHFLGMGKLNQTDG